MRSVELQTANDFRDALASGLPIVITDVATGVRLHRAPAACSWVREANFRVKVIEHRAANGGYVRVPSERAARERWPDLSVCQKCA